MPLPSRPIPTPAQRRPGNNVARKHLPHRFSPASERAEMALHLPLLGPVCIPQRPASAEEPKRVISVELGDLIDASRGKARAPRTSTAATLGFQLVPPMPSVLSLPDTPFPNAPAKAPSSHKLQLSSPSTPALIADDDMEVNEDDDEWEHVPMLDDDGELVVVGELELDNEPAVTPSKHAKASYAAVTIAAS